ncbi:tandem-95 repeat protein [Ningiella sp. W23]|uniref:tandem-95 repeat protein n=1 Tax=Ningiella sp. W23 TaxID=3023715 RepID=UPI00375751DF
MDARLQAGLLGLAIVVSSGLGANSAHATTPLIDNQLPEAGLAGEQVCFGASFSHTGDPGFGPYLQVVTDSDLSLSSASLFGNGLTVTTVGIFPSTAPFELTDPFSNEIVTGIAGQTLSLVTKSVGSVVEGGPELTAELCATINSGAEIGTPLNLSIAPAYRFGDTSIGANGPVIGVAVNKTITPELYEYTFTASSPEQEIAPTAAGGVPFVHTINVADGSTISNLNVSQVLNSEMIAQTVPVITGGTGCVISTAPAVGINGGNLEVDCASVTGSASTEDILISYQAIVDDVLNTASCAALPIIHTGESDAQFPPGAPLSTLSNNASFSAKHITLQQSLSDSSLIPGLSYTVTNSIQVSDYADPTAAGMIITDTLSDGLSFDAVGSLSVNGGASVSYSPVITTNGDGTQSVVYNLNDAGLNIAPGNSVVISYTVIAEQTFRQSSAPVLANDTLNISSALAYGLEGGASACAEDSSSSATVTPIGIEKSIVGGLSDFDPGEGISFRLRVNIPSGDIPAFSVTDYLPLAVFSASDISTTFGDNITFSPADTLGQAPTITIDAATNAVILSLPAQTDIAGEVIEYDLATAISTDPYADGLFLTNIIQSNSANTNGEPSVLFAPVSFSAKAPVLEGVLTQTLPTVRDAGDTVDYILELTNIGSASAFDIMVDVPASAGLETATLISVTIDGMVASTSGSLASGDFTITGPVAPAQVVELNFSRVISDDVVPLQSITSSATTSWANAIAAAPFPDIVTEQTFNIDNLSITTTVDSVSPEGSMGNVVVGDVVTYQTEVRLPESEIDDFNIDLVLPAGFTFVNGSASVDSAGFVGTVDASPTASTPVIVGGQQSLDIAFSGTTATTSDNTTTNNSFTLTFDALVADDSANVAISALQNKELSSSADFTGRTGATVLSNATSSFAEHNLNVSTVATNSDGETGGFEAGDEVTVEVTITNNGTAPAYDVIFDSVVNGDLFDLGTVTEDTTPPSFTFSYSSPTVSYTASNVTLNPGDDIVFSYTAVVRDDVRSGSNFTVTSSATGSSLNGMPAVERENTQSDDAILNTQTPTIGNLQVINTSEAWSDNARRDIFAIGELVTYQFEATLPEGLTSENSSKSLLSVVLPRSYEYQTGSALIRGDFDTTLNSANEGDLNATDTAITPSLSGQRLNFNLGDITNEDDDADEEKIFITFDVLVLNNRNNNRGNRKNVSAEIAFINQASVPQSNTTRATSFIGEPRLELAYSVAPTTVRGSSNVIFETVFSNRSSGLTLRAWEFELEQTLPAELTPAALPLLSAVLSRGSTDVTACASLAGQVVTLDSSCLAANDAYLGSGESITVQLEAVVDPFIRFGQSASTSASVKASSLPGLRGTSDAAPGAPNSDNGERTGDRVVNTSNQSVNDLFVIKTASVIAETPSIELSLSDSSLQVGEVLTVTQQIALPVGTTDDFIATLDLPDGLLYDNNAIRITTPSSDFSNSLTPNLTPGSGSDPINLDFGSVVNSAGDSQIVTVEIDLIVDNVLGNQNGEILPIGASLDYADILSDVPSDNADVQVIEANLELSQTIIEGATDADAGDVVTYRTVISNTSAQATAYNVSFADVFDAQLLGAPDGTGSGVSFIDINVDNPGNEVLLTASGSAVAVSDFGQATTSTADDTFELDGTMIMPPNSSITLEYSVAISNTATAGATLTNASALAYTSDEASSGRDGSDSGSDDDSDTQLNNYNETTSSSLTLANNLAIQSQLNDIHADNDFVPGESIFIDIRLDVSEGQEPNTIITNALPVGLEFIAATVNAGSNISYTGDVSGIVDGSNNVTFDFGTLTNVADNDPSDDFLVLTLEARVLDIPSNSAGTTLTNFASATGAGTSVGPAAVPVDIVEPSVTATISSAKDVITLGDTTSFTVDIRATDLAADAFDTEFEIVIPNGFTYQPGSLTGPGIIDDSDPTRLVVDVGTLNAADGSLSFIFDAQLNNDAAIGTDFEFEIDNGMHSSQAGDADEERSYEFVSTHTVRSDDASFIDASQSLSIVTDNNGNGIADPGDELGKSVLITNNGPRVDGVSFDEAIPDNTTYVASSLNTTKGTVDDSTSANVDIGELASGEQVTINFTIEVNAGTPVGTLIQAQGVVNSDSTIPELTDADGNDANGDQANEIRVGDSSALTPALNVSQSISLLSDINSDMAVSETDILEFSYTLSNVGNMDLTNIDLIDLLPSGLSYVPSSISIGGPADAGDSALVTGADIEATIASLAANESVTITLQASIDSPLVNLDGIADTETFSAQASVVSDQTPALLSDSNGNLADGAQAATITAVATGVTPEPDVVVSQSYVLVNDIDGDGLVDPGDTVQLVTTIINNGAANADAVTAGQSIPSNTTLVPGSEQTSRGVTTDPGAGLFNANIGSIAPGETVITSFDVVVDALSADTVLSSQQIVSASNFADTASDANADLSDGATPTLINVFVGDAPEYMVSTSLTNTSDSTTAGNEFVQGEGLTLELDATFPQGLTRDGRLSFTLPSGMSYESGTAQIKRRFDSGISAGDNPGNVNTAVDDVFVTVPVVVSGSTVSIDLGNVISTDSDADLAGFVLAMGVDTSALIPSALTQSFAIQSALAYNDDALIARSAPSNNVDMVLLNRLPTASPDSLSVDEDSGASVITPITNDNDPDSGQMLMLVSAGPASAGGTLNVNTMTGAIEYTPADDFSGTETIAYTVTDGAGGQSSSIITVTVNPLPDAPVANPDAATTAEETPVTIDVLGNDTDADGDALTVTLATSPDGTVTVNPDGSITFTPEPEFSGTATIVYEISDGNGGTATSNAVVTVAPVNDDPIGTGQSLTTPEDTPISFNPLIGASDPDGDALRVTNVSASSGTVTLNPDGTISFIPAPDFTGSVTITYDIDDGNGGVVSVTSTVDVTPVNDAPVANADSAATPEDTPVTVDVLSNDTDADGDELSIASATSPNGTVAILPSGEIVFTPNPDFNGTALITYTLEDETGLVDTGTLTIDVTDVNDPPLVPGQILPGREDTPVIFDPLKDASDADGDDLTITDLAVSSGTVVENADGTITFTPDPDFNGPVTVTYNVDDGNGGVTPVTVEINVEPEIDPPVANPDVASTPEDTPITIDAIANDTDPDGDVIDITSAVSAQGDVSIDAAGNVLFTPNEDFTGEALINYTLTDATGEVTTGTITVDVTPVNDPPVASDQTLVALEDTPLRIDPLLTATDIDGDTLTVTDLVVSSGTISLNADGTVTFTPDPDFNGPVTLTYNVDDGNGGVVPVTVFINVQEVVDAPVANPDTASTNEDEAVTIDVLSNDTDVDSTELSITTATSADGDVVITDDGELIFTPSPDFNGTATIEYTVTDETGQSSSTTVTVDVLPVNDPPLADDINVSMDEDTVLNIDVLASASDPDGDSLSISDISSDIGEVSIGPDGSIFFMPPANYNGPATITYTVDDGNGGLTTVTVNIDVLPVNDEPVLPPIAASVPVDESSTIDITSLIEDSDSDSFTIASATVAVGDVVINPDGTISYTPPPGFIGLVTGEVCVEDDMGALVCAELNITVFDTNTAPIAMDQAVVTLEDTSVMFVADVSDAEGQPLSFTLLSMPDGTLLGTGPDFTFIPNDNFSGVTSFTYQVNDGEADSNVATVTITVQAVNDAPIANDDFVEMSADQSTININVLANDEDPDGDMLSIVDANAVSGTVEIVDGELVYTPIPGFVGNDVIEYTIEDENGEQATARVLVTVGGDGSGLNPVLTVPEDITIDATGLFTPVELGVASAIDQFGNPLPVSIIDGLILYPPGVNTVFYVAEDSEGRRTVATQTVNVNPLVSIQNDQSVIEGSSVRVSVHLNGPSPTYPLVVPFSISGSAGSADHDLISGQVVFDNTTEAFIEFKTFEDGFIEDIEEVIITLSDSVNIGENFEHVVSIVETNVNPVITLFASQDGEVRNVVVADGGLVTIDSLIEHPDLDNQYSFEWANTELALDDVDDSDETYTFDPSTAPPGVYEFTVTITDIDDPSFTASTVVYLQIVADLPDLGSDDTDMDGIADDEEGFNDSDGDGIFDWQDGTAECNVLQQEVDSRDRFLIEGEPGVCMRIGQFAFGTASGGALIYQSEIANIGTLRADTLAGNVGGINDFIAYGMPAADDRLLLTLPQRRPIPQAAVYRHYNIEDGWAFFDETGDNGLFSAPGEPGFCPPPGSGEYEPGLVAGYYCVQLEIVDGGANDSDDVANASVLNTGFVGVVDAGELPDAIDDSATTFVEQEVIIDALANDIDPAAGGLIITSVDAFFGNVSIIAGEQGDEIRYVPTPGFSGVDEIRYGIVDSNGLTDVAVITVMVNGNLPPIAVDDIVSVRTSGTVSIDVLDNDSDPEGGLLTVTSATSSDGSVSIQADGSLSFTPNSGALETALIQYSIVDDQGLIATAVVRITIEVETVRIENKSSGGGSLGIYALILLLLAALLRRYAQDARRALSRRSAFHATPNAYQNRGLSHEANHSN